MHHVEMDSDPSESSPPEAGAWRGQRVTGCRGGNTEYVNLAGVTLRDTGVEGRGDPEFGEEQRGRGK